ncbi:hypothetical protein C5167_000822 [Papaver somniferum]|uniref:Mitochondrial import inner membrane translocase subunit TIM22 n=1 Tax=Papaver somniferum TaxID=3469 RepID=A0A4Y7KUY0_PAPSO|nr:hypothetical protein C5167_000822 [Papaver somniferum]
MDVVVRIPKDNNKQITNQLRIISSKLTELETKFKEFGNGYRNWVSKQSFPVEATVATTSGAIQGAAFGGLFGAAAQVAGHVFPEHSPAIKAFCSGPVAEARIMAAMEGARASVTCIMKRIKGKEDVQTRMAAGFGAGATLGMIRPRDSYGAVYAAMLGVVGALVGGVFFQLGQKTSQLPGEYTRTRCMLSNLGLQNYEENFKKGLLTDITMPLLTDRQVLSREFVSPVLS